MLYCLAFLFALVCLILLLLCLLDNAIIVMKIKWNKSNQFYYCAWNYSYLLTLLKLYVSNIYVTCDIVFTD